MGSFSVGVQSTSLVVLLSLLVYTLALMRTGRLTAHVTVRWVLAELAALFAVLLWGKLPVIAYTSSLGDRELLVILAVLFFALVTFLMLDSLQRISAQAVQIRRLTQEVAFLRAGPPSAQAGSSPAILREREDSNLAAAPPQADPAVAPIGQMLLAAWVAACIAFYAAQAYGYVPAAVLRLLTAEFKH